MFSKLTVISLFAVLLPSSIRIADSHTSIADPTPVSYVNNCRLGNGVHCPGPCPNQLYRKERPTKTVRRGGVLRVITRKNNHFGGFARWSIVKVKHMWKKHEHNRGAFLYTCHDLRLSRCDYKNRFWCKDDKTNQYYAHKFVVPQIYPDGDYVLGFAWYGGLFSTKDIGNFGDYYDCMYIRVQGGPKKWQHFPEFHAGPTATGRGGYCSATVNRLGTCWREPCKVNGKSRRAEMLKPHEFINGRRPKPILYPDFK